MSIAYYCKCDNCKDRLSDGDSIFCSGCWDSITKELEHAKERIEELEREIEELSK